MKITGLLTALVVGSALVLLPQTASAASTAGCTWRASALPVPAGASILDVDGTDHSGGWAGTAYFSGDRWHILSWKNGTVTDYGPVAPTTTAFVRVVDENRSGTIIGNSTDGQWGQIKTAFRIRAGVLEQLAVLPGGSQAIAAAINDTGDIVGTNLVQRNGSWGTAVVRWPANQAAPVEMPGLPLHSTAIDLDEDGTLLVGLRNPETQGQVPHVLRGGVLSALPPLARNQTPYGRAISNGRVTGSVLPKGGQYTGVVWERDLTPHTLPNAGEGLLINRDALVVASHASAGLSHGVWRGSTLEHAFGTFDDHVYTGAISDDGTFAGDLRGQPTVWRCT